MTLATPLFEKNLIRSPFSVVDLVESSKGKSGEKMLREVEFPLFRLMAVSMRESGYS